MSNWADFAISQLEYGGVVQIRPLGRSMEPLIKSGALVTLAPPREDDDLLAVGDIVLVTIKGSTYLHLIKEIKDGCYLIGNNRGGTNGWASAHDIHGKLIKVEE